MGKLHKNAKGFGTVEIIFGIVIVALIGAIGWFVYKNHNKTTPATTTVTRPATTKTATTPSVKTPSSNNTTLSNGTKTSVTPYGGSSIGLMLPDGWSSLSYGQFSKTISGVNYKVGFQITESDYLKGSYGGNASVLKTVKTAAGTTVYVIKTADSYVAVSSCAPVKGKGCSLTQNGKPLLVILNSYQSGDQYVRELNFGLSSTDTAISDFESIAASLSI